MGILKYLRELFSRWRDIILLIAGILLILLACTLPMVIGSFFTGLGFPEPLALLTTLICSPVLLLLALIPWSFMRTFPVRFGAMPPVWLPQEPVQGKDFSLFKSRHRMVVITAAGANILFSLCLLGYLVWIAQTNSWNTVTEDTSVFIWLLWLVTNGLIIVGFCLSEIFRDFLS